MDISNTIIQILSIVSEPAFIASNGQITHVNTAAEKLGFEPGADLDTILGPCKDIYHNDWSGTIKTLVTVNGIYFGAKAHRLENCDLFTVKYTDGLSELRVLSLASIQLRDPVFNLLNSSKFLKSEGKRLSIDEINTQNGVIFKSIYQIHRVVSNMADAYDYRSELRRDMEGINVCSFFKEVLEKAAAHLDPIPIAFSYKVPETEIYCNIEKYLMERAIYNMLSNAIQAEAKEIIAELTQQGRQLRFSVCDRGSKEQIEMRTQLLTNYLRKPKLEDTEHGLGLGMVIIQTAANIHGGTLSVQQADDGLDVSITISITPDNDLHFKQRTMLIDYTGGVDITLSDLSDILPSYMYEL